MLEIRNISKSFLQRGLVLDNLCLSVKEGDSIAIMGPSGSGKTTLMNIIGLLDRPDSGEVFFKGSSVQLFNDSESARYRNKNIGFVFQDHLLLPHLSVRDNILLPLLASDDTTEERILKIQYAGELMEKTGIRGLEAKLPSRISGGEAQRAALVRALVNKPSILLADEPSGSLDSKNATILANLLAELNIEAGITLLLSTHSAELARKMAHQFVIEDGKLKG
jgi:lipoprotein-releasing system ATP-binding protein